MDPSDRVGAILVGAGRSRRMGGMNKVFAPLLGQPLLSWPIEVFQSSPLIHQIVLVLSRGSLIKGRR
ncbi:MAG: NTP transferase domain-containing protein, partial [Chloroflexota bacterium]|nr:NTP transferase domain-containing protein [Chloroflexota bacterium]